MQLICSNEVLMLMSWLLLNNFPKYYSSLFNTANNSHSTGRLDYG